MKIVLLAPAIETAPYCWIVEIGLNSLGVHQYDGWCIKLGNRIVSLDSENKFVPLGPILEIEEETFFNFLRDTKEAYPAYANSIDRFPKVMFLKHIFHTSFSDYWPEKALAWLKADQSIQKYFSRELEQFVKNKIICQSLRQKANKILQRLQYMNDET